MAESNHLSQLDRPEIINSLFKNRKDSYRTAKESNSTNKPEILTAISRDGTEIHCKVFRGIPEEPHILFFPAEYDGEASIIDLATGFGQLGITLITMD
ncbi:MAG: hypothetical protein KAV69_07715, partial [Deltaproteobacteria bacterium]|nr:hypothetical protein [Deltaproteobacteria bacterium]